ncbi:hypothetical protein NHX12_025225 [Muraenolepis orangiensis]|uniref:C2H2-type domain-containing protein n=1 Tax=Muraenolepis orangiensis TaxID=630683 RepID=A0A9Q0EIW0_9TELE|nr:hypothetical protein NHX12_025225 [Muraenolepis orangiensis]
MLSCFYFVDIPDVCLPVGDGVCTTAPPLHSTETILIQEETLLKANMLDYFCSDYMDTSGRERTVEMSTAESASVGFDTKDKISGADGQPGKVNSRKDVACNIQKTAPSHRLNVELDSCAVELPLGCNIEVPECMGHTDTAQPPEEDTPPPVTTGEDEQVKLSVKMDGYSTSEGQSCAGINMEKENKNQHLRNTCKSDVAPALILAIVGAPSPTPTNEETPAPSDLAIRPARKNRGLKMKRFLTIAAKTVSKDLLASKTCRTCGKTYSRSSDMRRHQRTHTGERLFRCPRCKKYFQFRHDLRRHISSSCHVAGLQSGVESPQALEDQTARDQSQSCTSSAQPTEMSNQVKTAPCPRGTGHSDSQGTRSLRSLEECSSLGKEIPLAAVQTPTQPNQAVVEGRLESTLLQVDIEDGCQGKQNQPLQGSTPAAESAMPIVDILLEAASFEGRTDEEPQLIKTTDAKEINSPVCLSVVKETPRSHQRAPLHSPPLACPNCEVKFKSKSALKRHMVKSCKVEKMALEEADAAIQRFKTQKENRMGRKCTGESKEADSTFHCAECDMSFPDTTRLVAHNVIHKPRPCTMCDQTFNGVLEVNQHYIDVHHFLGPFPCALCDRVFPGLKGLIRHERVHTSELPLQSPKCPKASGLKLHDRTPTKEALFLCWDCGKGCRSNGALRIHRLCHHGSTEDKCFSCEHCGKSYALKHSLDLHVAKLHTGVRYPCAHCGKLFRSASSLTRHDLMHTQERPFSCRECGKSFRSASELKVHARYHTGERPFKCQECGKGFVQSYYLTVHTRTHSGEKPYPCPTCDKCFKSAGTLKRHRLTHTGEKPHNCSVCEMAFSRHQLLKSHVTKLHNK